ncbi:hypothetical protein [Cohnella terricola]|uniref:Spore coat protein n=1 Tax=Cohnella terricola TaxID=1289167 RepID=A0A559JJ82_9BACL|nr:hypothetical protein [Cohnella terricola]TVX99931.1 hypothetical protein FPZ45_13490 [Cohnella terricola]
MVKWASWVIRVVATALLLSFLCIWTTGYIVNSYMESVLKQLDIPLEIKPMALSGVWGTLWGADKSPKKNADSSGAPSKKQLDGAGEPESTPAAENRNGEPGSREPDQGNRSGTVLDEKADEDKPDELSNAIPNPGVSEDDAVPAFGGTSAASQLTDEQRQTLYATVVSKLNQEQLKQLSDSLQGGLTPEGLTQVQEMLKSALTDEEYSQMMEMLQGQREPESDAPPH